MTYRKRLILLILLDSLTVSTAIFLAAWLVYPTVQDARLEVIVISAVTLLVFHHFFAFIYKLYHKVWAYASVGELIAILKAVTLSIFAAGVVQFFINDFAIYRRALLVTWMLHILFIGGSRFIWRIYRERCNRTKLEQRRTLIVGAGAAGSMVARQLINEQHHVDICPVAFVDDDKAKQKMEIYGLPVAGAVKDISRIAEKYKVELIVIAIPSLKNGELRKIMDYCQKTDAKVQMIPKIEDIMTGKVSVSQLKNVEVEDLLGREPVKLDIDAISEYVAGKTVMVTGAGGSIGSEICRQLMKFIPGKILLLGHGENSIYQIHMELKEKYHDTDIEIIPVIGDIQDRTRIFEIIEEHRPEIIYHAAAHKHVPMMEFNPHEAVKNNIIGTKNVADAANAFGVDAFVLVSTDKAVNPTNVMGATKRIAEMIIQDLSKQSKTKFVAVRFGNVLGSRGSVIPLFKKQIAKGGPVTVTHPDMTRYFMTIPEASRLVIQAGTLAKGGEIFVLDMGEPVKIVDLARNLIKLSGYTEEEIPIVFTGIRPGEKMFEELLNEEEIHPDAVYEKIYVGRTTDFDTEKIDNFIQKFQQLETKKVKEELLDIVYAKKKSAVV
ncbi:UDP-N-acetylglucosamine 4,6-dehydratase [Compostibacillus humi]|uniref:UDP-N-acetylglucosamine 4,6-dehydratase n=1 Tax=Compostibacillus humi TaxID=1245525 RepID=A0A8J2XFQ1_9BACI|nr:nucleoside-diphosphate sugar epimerase/dehydratase [Compostibacillus humi]GFZ79997.1 UDP-N-acetylglucosamine 4,6-dehydratase [Compostibacillus humi]